MAINIAALGNPQSVVSRSVVSPNGQELLMEDYVIDGAIKIYYAKLEQVAVRSQALYAVMIQNVNLSREAQRLASDMQAKITQMTDPNAKEQPDAATIEFMRKNNIYMTDDQGRQITIDDWLKADPRNWSGVGELPKLNKADLTVIQNALNNTADKASDLSSQDQLKIQNETAQYQAGTAMITQVQQARKDMLLNIINKT